MPHLLLFAPCQKAIIDKSDGSISMIGLVQGFTAQQETDEPIPANAVVPVPWSAVIVWQKEASDEGRVFEQKLVIVAPEGGLQPDPIVVSFKMENRIHQLTLNGSAFPMGVRGEYKLSLSLRDVGNDDWQHLKDYPLIIEHIRVETVNELAQPQTGS